MTRWLAGGIMVIVAVAGSMASGEKPKTPSKQKADTLTGEVVDVSCWLKDGRRGDAHRRCATMCGENGLPMGLLVTKGDKDTLYLALASAEGDAVNKGLLPHVAETVKVTGKIVNKGGMRAVWVETVERVPGK